MPNQLDLLKDLKAILYDILGNEVEGGVDVLGEFEFIENGLVIGTSPSIRIGFPLETDRPIIRMKENSGIQCIIDNNVIKNYNYQMNRTIIGKELYPIILDQYNPYSNLIDAIDAIVKMPILYSDQQPIISPSRSEEEGFIPSRAILYLRRYTTDKTYF